MRRKLLVLPLVAFAAIAGAVALAGNGTSSAQEGPLPTPSAGKVITTEPLLQPKGLAMGPDGMLYVAESGSGGTTPITVDGGEGTIGNTGRISKIDPNTGARTTVADGLPSHASSEGEAVGPADVAFIGSTLYYLQTHAGEAYGFPGTPTGIYRVTATGDTVLVADLGQFNIDNPVDAITDGTQPDVEVGGNPYSMQTRLSQFYVVDGNHNRLLRSTTGGAVSQVVEFPDHPVSTGIDITSDGTIYVSYLGVGPFFPEDGKVVRVNPTTGVITQVAAGVAMLTDVEFGPGNQLYALQINDPQEAGEAFFAPGTGKIVKVNGDGTMSPIVTGLSFPTFMLFDGDTAYVSNMGIAPIGSIVKIENFSAVTPPAPQPTAAPTQAPVATPTRPGGITGPDTGSGGFADSDGGSVLPFALALAAGVAILGSGALLRMKRR